MLEKKKRRESSCLLFHSSGQGNTLNPAREERSDSNVNRDAGKKEIHRTFALPIKDTENVMIHEILGA
jgi:hypothetical protein